MKQSESVNRAVRERPLLLSGPMVRAILEGRKTQTRRVVKHSINAMDAKGVSVTHRVKGDRWEFLEALGTGAKWSLIARCPYGQPGDRLWVRETWVCDLLDAGDYSAAPGLPLARTNAELEAEWRAATLYRADGELQKQVECADDYRWKPSIHMPRWASRLSLEITEVRVQRLQEVTAADCIAEGIPSRGMDRDGPNIASALMYIEDYKDLWNDLNEKRGYGWDANPWVWAISFRSLESLSTSPSRERERNNGD